MSFNFYNGNDDPLGAKEDAIRNHIARVMAAQAAGVSPPQYQQGFGMGPMQQIDEVTSDPATEGDVGTGMTGLGPTGFGAVANSGIANSAAIEGAMSAPMGAFDGPGVGLQMGDVGFTSAPDQSSSNAQAASNDAANDAVGAAIAGALSDPGGGFTDSSSDSSGSSASGGDGGGGSK